VGTSCDSTMNLSMGSLSLGCIPLSNAVIDMQIALFALPLCVVVGWMTGHPFSLSLDPFSALVLTFSVVHSNSESQLALTQPGCARCMCTP
jgi:hypothetical protein